MKIALKITGITLVILALVFNIHNALFTFYGIKTNNLTGAVWAQSTSTSTSGGTSGTSSDGVWWDEQTSGCYVTEGSTIAVKTYANANATASIGFVGNTVNSVSLGAGGTFTQENQYMSIYTAGSKVSCPTSPFSVCSSVGCSYAPGAKASYVILNGRRIDASTSGN